MPVYVSALLKHLRMKKWETMQLPTVAGMAHYGRQLCPSIAEAAVNEKVGKNATVCRSWNGALCRKTHTLTHGQW